MNLLLFITPMLTRRGCEYLKNTLSPDFLAKIRTELRVTPFSKGSVAVVSSFRVYDETPTTLTVPHFWGLNNSKTVEVHDTRPPPHPVSLTFKGVLDDTRRQPEVVQKAMHLLRTKGGCVVCAKTGQGKTACALAVCALLNLKTVVIVHKTFLVDQWKERAAQFVPDARTTVYGNGSLDVSGDIVLATIQTILSRGFPGAEAVGLVIIDEAHRLAAPAFSKVSFAGLNAPYMLGLSATPERADKLGCIVQWMCGPLVSCETSGPLTAVHVHIKQFPKARILPTRRDGEIDHSTLLTELAEDDERSAFLVEWMCDVIPTTEDCLVLSHRRLHCSLLAEALKMRGYDAGVYVGGIKTCPDTKVICATYALVSEGFDEPRLTALVLATPASEVTQVVGRILRKPGPKTILDLVDTNPVSRAQAWKRKNMFTQAGFKFKSSQSSETTTEQKKKQRYMFID